MSTDSRSSEHRFGHSHLVLDLRSNRRINANTCIAARHSPLGFRLTGTRVPPLLACSETPAEIASIRWYKTAACNACRGFQRSRPFSWISSQKDPSLPAWSGSCGTLGKHPDRDQAIECKEGGPRVLSLVFYDVNAVEQELLLRLAVFGGRCRFSLFETVAQYRAIRRSQRSRCDTRNCSSVSTESG